MKDMEKQGDENRGGEKGSKRLLIQVSETCRGSGDRIVCKMPETLVCLKAGTCRPQLFLFG